MQTEYLRFLQHADIQSDTTLRVGKFARPQSAKTLIINNLTKTLVPRPAPKTSPSKGRPLCFICIWFYLYHNVPSAFFLSSMSIRVKGAVVEPLRTAVGISVYAIQTYPLELIHTSSQRTVVSDCFAKPCLQGDQQLHTKRVSQTSKDQRFSPDACMARKAGI